MEDDNSMSERILRNLETIINNDPELNEFAIIPGGSNITNKSPVLYEEHNLALESWCVKHLYRYAYLELFEVRRLLAKRKLHYSKEQNLNRLLEGVLLVNPDVGTFWNMKRELVENDVLCVRRELLFAKLVLSYKSKSNETFGYRRWLVRRIVGKLQVHEVEHLLQNELNVCGLAAAKSPNNYHSWTHRIWCLGTLGVKVANFADLVSQELEFTQKWIFEHVSEHTGYHYRQHLINALKNLHESTPFLEYYYNFVIKSLNLITESDPKDLVGFLLGRGTNCHKNLVNYICLLLFDLYNTVETISQVYSNHESLWYHRRYLMTQLITAIYDHQGIPFKIGAKIPTSVNCDGEKQPKISKTQRNEVESTPLYQILVRIEGEFIRKKLQTESDLSRKYEKWLKFVIGMDDV